MVSDKILGILKKTLSFKETTVSDKILVSSVLSQSFLVADERSVLLNINGNRTRLGRHSACIGKRKIATTIVVKRFSSPIIW